MALLLVGSALSVAVCPVQQILSISHVSVRKSTAIDVNKCLKRVKLPISLHAVPSLIEQPANSSALEKGNILDIYKIYLIYVTGCFLWLSKIFRVERETDFAKTNVRVFVSFCGFT